MIDWSTKPNVCLNRYKQHTLPWHDEQGVRRCRRCHQEMVPPRAPSKTTLTSRQQDYLVRKAAWAAKQPKAPVHNPECGHPPALTDPVAIHEDAQRRMNGGEAQRECPVCKEWVWEQQFYDVNDKGAA